MSSRRTWVVAASIAAVEALKDQRYSGWNYPIKSLQQYAHNKFRSYSNARTLSAASTSYVLCNKIIRSDQKLKQSEDSLKNVMYLNCWGPS